MSRHDPSAALRHMRDHAAEVESFVRGRSRDDLTSDRLLYHAVIRLLEIIGEAATRIPDQMRTRHPSIPWRQISGLRNRLIHGYDAVDIDVVWRIVQNDVPPLIEQLNAALELQD